MLNLTSGNISNTKHKPCGHPIISGTRDKPQFSRRAGKRALQTHRAGCRARRPAPHRSLTGPLPCRVNSSTQQDTRVFKDLCRSATGLAGVPVFLLLLLFTLRGCTTSSWSKSSEQMTLNLCVAGWLPSARSSGAARGPEPLSVEVSEPLLLPGSPGSDVAVPDGLSARPGSSRVSRTEKEGFGLVLLIREPGAPTASRQPAR